VFRKLTYDFPKKILGNLKLLTQNCCLNVICCRTGSQWRSHKTGIICSDLLAPVTRRAAAFWITCINGTQQNEASAEIVDIMQRWEWLEGCTAWNWIVLYAVLCETQRLWIEDMIGQLQRIRTEQKDVWITKWVVINLDNMECGR